MPTFVLKCPKCKKTTQIKSCFNCGAGSGSLVFDRYPDGSIRGVGCKKCGMVALSYHCPNCGLEYNPAILKAKGCLGCPVQALIMLMAIVTVIVLVNGLIL